MTIRIDQRASGELTVLEIGGWLEEEEVDELERVARAASRPLALDLSGLRSAGRRGVDSLRSLAGEGVELRSVPPFVRLLLESRSGRSERGMNP